MVVTKSLDWLGFFLQSKSPQGAHRYGLTLEIDMLEAWMIAA